MFSIRRYVDYLHPLKPSLRLSLLSVGKLVAEEVIEMYTWVHVVSSSTIRMLVEILCLKPTGLADLNLAALTTAISPNHLR